MLGSMHNKTIDFKYPAEWGKQVATWLSFPHNENEWGFENLKKIQEYFFELMSIILDFQDVRLIFSSEEYFFNFSQRLNEKLSDKKYKLQQLIIPNNDIWIRDYGPFFMTHGRKKMILDFEFNSWGEKFPPWDLDNEVPKKIAMHMALHMESYPLVLEGGALEFNGNGLLITTEQCLLNVNRNPTISKETYESILKQAFNLQKIIWLKRGLEGDHTDGHIDDFVRFVSENKVVICATDDESDPNYTHLQESKEILLYNGLDVIEIPLPEKMFVDGERIPNSYTNFIYVNNGLIVPTFNCSQDLIALDIFKTIFPKRKIIGIDSTLLIQQGGGIHCMSKQESE